MAFRCPYCSHGAHSTPIYMTCEESALCQQCGLSESDAWLRRQEDELVTRFSTYSITPQVEQQAPITQSKPNTNRIHYASAAAHSFPVSPYASTEHLRIPNATWTAGTYPNAYDSEPVSTSASLNAFAIQMDCDLGISDSATVTTDSKRSSLDAGSNPQPRIVGNFDHENTHAEPYMSLGYEDVRERDPAQAAKSPTEPSTGARYIPCKDPVYNARSWWEYGEERREYRWDCLREHAM